MVGYDTLSLERRSCRVYIGIGEKEFWSRGYGTDAMRRSCRTILRICSWSGSI